MNPDKDKDIDNEFENLMGQAGFKEASLSEEIELDLESWEHLDSVQAQAGTVALIVTNLLDPLPLQGIKLGLNQPGTLVATETGYVIWMQLEEEDFTSENEFEALLGEERPLPKKLQAAAEVFSRMIPYGVVAFYSALKDSDESDPGVNGQIIGRMFCNGKAEEVISAGVFLANVDEIIEDLLLGRTTPADYPEVPEISYEEIKQALKKRYH